MKTLYLIGGTMGVGKTTASRILLRKLPNAVFLDGDWCWYADPFVVTDETKAMVMSNIRHTLNAFLTCTVYENVIFCWVMHEQTIIDDILDGLDLDACRVVTVSLTADETSLRARLEADVNAGLRTFDDVDRSVARLPLYERLQTVHIDTNGKTAEQVADAIRSPGSDTEVKI